jgi:hypothetical protein
VDFIDGSKEPPLYKLKDLLNDEVPGFYYEAQLTKAPDPNYKKDFFEVEKVLGTKTIKGKKFYLVKYLYYPPKFNQYVPEENFKH